MPQKLPNYDDASNRNEPVYLEVINLKGERERYAIR